MSRDYRRSGASRKSALAAVLCLAGAAALAGCTELKTAMGLDHNAPDEFAVESRAPLSVPPEFNLRPPEPGAHRPQEVPSDKLARAALDHAGPGKPGDQAPSISLGLNSHFGGAVKPNPEAEVTPDSLASRLLRDNGTAVAVGKRETTPLKDVY